jgi:L-alanine-DL-glutamate epimerase-like enolase superfamily enzyme
VRITGVSTTVFRCPDRQQTLALVELHTDAALIGIAVAPADVDWHVRTLVAEVLTGEDPRAVTALWQRLRQTQGVRRVAAAAIDSAMWDLKAKAHDEPLWRALGALRPRVNVHALTADLALVQEHGIRGGTLALSDDADRDLQRLTALHATLTSHSDAPTLVVAADGRWSADTAIERIRALEARYDVAWIESPTRSDDPAALRRVSDAVRAAVCVGRDLDAPAALLPHFEQHAVDVVQIDSARHGVTGAMQLADAAFGLELPVTLCDSIGIVHAHLAAAMASHASMEVALPMLAPAIVSSDVRIENGWAVAGDRAGNGLVVNRDALARAVVTPTDMPT